MKRLATILLFLVLSISLVACGGSSSDSGDTTDTAESRRTETSEPAKAEPAVKEETTETKPAEPTPEEVQAAQERKAQEEQQRAQREQQKALEEQEKDVKSYGMAAIQEYGEYNYFPYGWNLHDIWGVINVEPMSDGTWFVKAECDYENEYGNKIDGVCEAYISGSGENWTVQQFIVY